MKTISQKVDLTLALEKDDAKNMTGMQMRVWKMNNGTTVVVRLFKHCPDSTNVLWSKKRTNGEVAIFVLENLKELRVVNDTENWDCSSSDALDFCKNDEFEEKDNCYYLSYSVRPFFLQF